MGHVFRLLNVNFALHCMVYVCIVSKLAVVIYFALQDLQVAQVIVY